MSHLPLLKQPHTRYSVTFSTRTCPLLPAPHPVPSTSNISLNLVTPPSQLLPAWSEPSSLHTWTQAITFRPVFPTPSPASSSLAPTQQTAAAAQNKASLFCSSQHGNKNKPRLKGGLLWHLRKPEPTPSHAAPSLRFAPPGDLKPRSPSTPAPGSSCSSFPTGLSDSSWEHLSSARRLLCSPQASD